MAEYSDSFDRGDSDALGASWVEDESSATALTIISNLLRCVLSAQVGFAYWNVAFLGDQFSELVFSSTELNNPVSGPAVRISGTNGSARMYAALYSPFDGQVQLRKYVDQNLTGAGTTLGTYAVTLLAGDKLHVRAEGSAIKVLINDVLRIDVIDGSVTGGKSGVTVCDLGYGGNARWNDWAGGDIGGGSGGAPGSPAGPPPQQQPRNPVRRPTPKPKPTKPGKPPSKPPANKPPQPGRGRVRYGGRRAGGRRAGR